MSGAHRAPSRGSTGHRRPQHGADRHAPYGRDPHAHDPYERDSYDRDPYDRDPYGRATPRRATPVVRPVRSGIRSATTGILAGALGMTAVTAVVMMMSRTGDSGHRAGAAAAAQSDLRAPRTGPILRLQTPEGYSYALAAVSRTAAASTAHADYVLTNAGAQPAPLDFPVDLFVRRDKVPAETQARCMPEPGAHSDSCTPPSHSTIIRNLNGSRAPLAAEGGDPMMPPGASYVVRITTDLPVAADTQPGDLRMVVWKLRYSPERKSIALVAP